MIQKLLWSLFGKKYLLGGVTELYRRCEGYRTIILATLAVVIYLLKTLQYIPAELADQLLAVCAGAGGITMTSKLNRIDTKFDIQKRMQELKTEAMKQLVADGTIPTVPDDKVTDGLCNAVLPPDENDGVRG